jgi:phenylpropionate dioxygenase-like ring-hydroxylating dioxygenase large terminal subunit
MTDLATAAALTSTPRPLSVDWYLDPDIFEAEIRSVFANGPGYVGHSLMLPHPGDYHVLDWMGNGKTLIRNAHGVDLLSNVCRHRQALILEGRGHARNLVCPVHRWTYDTCGTLLGAPHFPDKPCLDLDRTPLKTWNGMLFQGLRDPARDLAGLGIAADLSFEGYLFHQSTVTEYQYNWKAFMEVYLELYHVVPFHPGLGSFVDCDRLLRWELGDWYSAQVCGVSRELGKAGTPTYQRWQEKLLEYRGGEAPKYGALWFAYYPNIMIEWYPHALIVSHVIPRGPEACSNVVEYYYPEEIALFEPELIEAERAAYSETALEDAEICQRMHDGRRALRAQGVSEAGPYQSPMEDGVWHFHEFLRRHVEPELGESR